MNRKMRHKRIRKRLNGTKDRPRLSVARSLTGFTVQLIDDVHATTLAAAMQSEIKKTKDKIEQATLLGSLIAEKAKKKNIATVVFDRGGRKYHGRIKALAESARKGGLQF